VNERREIENVTETVKRLRLRDSPKTIESLTMTVERRCQMTKHGSNEERMVYRRVGKMR